MNRFLTLVALALVSLSVQAGSAPTVVATGGSSCVPGPLAQPSGSFGVFVFCDNALGTNIAVYYRDIASPVDGPWLISKRFWQNEKWALDVDYLAWLPDRTRLLVFSSPIYGEGAFFVLDLKNQTSRAIHRLNIENECGVSAVRIVDNHVEFRPIDCGTEKPKSTVRVPLSQSNQPLHPTTSGGLTAAVVAGERRR